MLRNHLQASRSICVYRRDAAAPSSSTQTSGPVCHVLLRRSHAGSCMFLDRHPKKSERPVHVERSRWRSGSSSRSSVAFGGRYTDTCRRPCSGGGVRVKIPATNRLTRDSRAITYPSVIHMLILNMTRRPQRPTSLP